MGSPLGGLDLRADAPKEDIRSAPRRAFERLVDYCISERIDLLLLAGDLFDGRADVDTQIFVERQLRRLGESGVKCVLLRGNHDAASKQVLQLRLPEGIRELSVRAAETIRFPELGVAVHGRGFADQHVTESIVDSYPAADPELFNIGMLHTSASGTGEHEVYAPCSVAQLTGKGYGYWALGHVHKRGVLASDPPVVFCGNLQGRHPKETGAKGATLVVVDDGVIVEDPAHIDFDVLRWHSITVDLDGARDENDVLTALEHEILEVLASGDEQMQHVVRIDVGGRTEMHRDIVDAQATWRDRMQQLVAEAGRDRVWTERIRLSTSPPLPAIDTLREREDMVGELARELADMTTTAGTPVALQTSLNTLAEKIPAVLLEGENAWARTSELAPVWTFELAPPPSDRLLTVSGSLSSSGRRRKGWV
ncbi:MAG: DNA repair exonuclease, partial [Solirubrobacteraceae bacterium]